MGQDQINYILVNLIFILINNSPNIVHNNKQTPLPLYSHIYRIPLTMLKSLTHLLVLVAALTPSIAIDDYDSKKTNQGVNYITKLKNENQQLKRQIVSVQDKLDECLRRAGKSATVADQCYEERSLKERFMERVRELEDKLKNMVSVNKNQDGIVQTLKNKIKDFQNKIWSEVQKANKNNQQKTLLQRKHDQLKDYYQKKIRDFQIDLISKERKYSDQLRSIKNDYEQKIRQSVGQKCDAISTEIYKKQQQCKKQIRTFGDKVRDLEQKAKLKAQEFADKIKTTKNQVVSNIKNFLTGKGPYTSDEKQAFGEFKDRVSSLQGKIKDKLDQIDRIRKQKQDLSFQQKYCKAKLSDYDSQIQQLEQQAQKKGKSYYTKEIQRLLNEKMSRVIPSSTSDSLSRSLQEKLNSLEQKLRNQQSKFNFLYNENKQLQDKLRTVQKQYALNREKYSKEESENRRLRRENQELRKLVKEIYQLKEK